MITITLLTILACMILGACALFFLFMMFDSLGDFLCAVAVVLITGAIVWAIYWMSEGRQHALLELQKLEETSK